MPLPETVLARCRGLAETLLLCLMLATAHGANAGETGKPPPQMLQVAPGIWLADSPLQLDALPSDLALVVDLRFGYEGVYTQVGQLRRLEIRALNIPVSTRGPSPAQVQAFDEALQSVDAGRVVVHDSNGWRTAAMWACYRVWKGDTPETALDSVRQLGEPDELRELVARFVERAAAARPAEG